MSKEKKKPQIEVEIVCKTCDEVLKTLTKPGEIVREENIRHKCPDFWSGETIVEIALPNVLIREQPEQEG